MLNCAYFNPILTIPAAQLVYLNKPDVVYSISWVQQIRLSANGYKRSALTTMQIHHSSASDFSFWIPPLHPLSTNAQFINIVLSLLSSSSFSPNTLRDREILRQLPKWQVKWEQEALKGPVAMETARGDQIACAVVRWTAYSTPQTKGHFTSITAHNRQPITLNLFAIFVQRSDACVHLGLQSEQYTLHTKLENAGREKNWWHLQRRS